MTARQRVLETVIRVAIAGDPQAKQAGLGVLGSMMGSIGNATKALGAMPGRIGNMASSVMPSMGSSTVGKLKAIPKAGGPPVAAPTSNVSPAIPKAPTPAAPAGGPMPRAPIQLGGPSRVQKWSQAPASDPLLRALTAMGWDSKQAGLGGILNKGMGALRAARKPAAVAGGGVAGAGLAYAGSSAAGMGSGSSDVYNRDGQLVYQEPASWFSPSTWFRPSPPEKPPMIEADVVGDSEPPYPPKPEQGPRNTDPALRSILERPSVHVPQKPEFVPPPRQAPLLGASASAGTPTPAGEPTPALGPGEFAVAAPEGGVPPSPTPLTREQHLDKMPFDQLEAAYRKRQAVVRQQHRDGLLKHRQALRAMEQADGGVSANLYSASAPFKPSPLSKPTSLATPSIPVSLPVQPRRQAF